jgi:hypothetical protein
MVAMRIRTASISASGLRGGAREDESVSASEIGIGGGVVADEKPLLPVL